MKDQFCGHEHAHMHTRMHTCTCTHMHTCMHAHTHMCTSLHTISFKISPCRSLEHPPLVNSIGHIQPLNPINTLHSSRLCSTKQAPPSSNLHPSINVHQCISFIQNDVICIGRMKTLLTAWDGLTLELKRLELGNQLVHVCVSSFHTEFKRKTVIPWVMT